MPEITNPNGVVTTQRTGKILVITINREHKRNALTGEITLGIDKAMNTLEDDDSLWCGVLTGGPLTFSAGSDLVEGSGVPTERGGILGIIQRRRTKPLIAAVEGIALGGGMELALCCDLIVASQNARFGLPEVKLGVLPAYGGVFRVSRFLPINVAKELLLTGDPISAERAERLGLVNVVTDNGHALEGAMAMAERICVNAPLAVRESLMIINEETSGDELDSWKRSNEAYQRLLATKDVEEGVQAFFERRIPTWECR
jgi:enoyl-CoA hydratase/carnithine racemase